jgi:hypothetical protein
MVAPARQRQAKGKSAAPDPSTQSEVELALSVTPGDASSYILSMVSELRALAIASQFRFLAYILEMAFQEAYRLSEELEEASGARGGDTGA